MMPLVVGQHAGACIVSVVVRSELEQSVCIHPEAILSHIQELGLALLLIGLNPELYRLIVLCIYSKISNREVQVGRAVQHDSLVLIIYIPCLAGGNQMTISCIVGNLVTLALVHLPVAHEVGRRWRLGLLTLQLCLGIVMSHIPQGEFVDGALHSLSDAERTHSIVSCCLAVTEESVGIC